MTIAAQIFAATPRQSALYNCILLLAEEQSSVNFIVLADEASDKPASLPKNIKWVIIKAAFKNRLRLHYWYNFTLPALLKKHGATHFVSETGALSLRITIPQFLLVNNTSFLLRRPVIPQPNDRYVKRWFPQFLNRAAGIFITENFLGQTLSEKYPSAKEKTIYTGHGLERVFQPISWEAQEQFLETFSNGTAYFVAEASPVTQANIFSLVKAFSLFKKRQKSSMQLLLLLKGVTIEDCIKDFHLYKYRADVKLVPFTTEDAYATILAASYGTLYLPSQIIADNAALNALAAGSPLITFENAAALNIYGDAALYAGLSETSLAENMMRLYKDEALRKQLIEKGLRVCAGYTWHAASDVLWQTITTAPAITG